MSGHGSVTCLLLDGGTLLAGDNSGYLRCAFFQKVTSFVHFFVKYSPELKYVKTTELFIPCVCYHFHATLKDFTHLKLFGRGYGGRRTGASET